MNTLKDMVKAAIIEAGVTEVDEQDTVHEAEFIGLIDFGSVVVSVAHEVPDREVFTVGIMVFNEDGDEVHDDCEVNVDFASLKNSIITMINQSPKVKPSRQSFGGRDTAYTGFSPLMVRCVREVMNTDRSGAERILKAVDDNLIQIDWSNDTTEQIREKLIEAQSHLGGGK